MVVNCTLLEHTSNEVNPLFKSKIELLKNVIITLKVLLYFERDKQGTACSRNFWFFEVIIRRCFVSVLLYKVKKITRVYLKQEMRFKLILVSYYYLKSYFVVAKTVTLLISNGQVAYVFSLYVLSRLRNHFSNFTWTVSSFI